MKIALAADNNQVSQHFGHCQGFQVFDIIEGQVKGEKFIENPGHKPGFLPKFLGDKGVNMIISGGMGQMAQKLFNDNNIQVITGAKGSIDDVLRVYLEGELKSSDEVCKEHEHEHECNNH